jgi:hypothetical protein
MTSRSTVPIVVFCLMTAVGACTSLPSSPPGSNATGGARAGSAGMGGLSVASGGAGGHAGAAMVGGGGSAAGGKAGGGAVGDTGGAGAGAAGGANSSGGRVGTGGVGKGGAGMGGVGMMGGAGTGGAAMGGAGTGGAATGGAGTGGVGMGTGGAGGGGGMPASCQGATTRCASGGLQTCSNGQWGNAIPCGSHESCAVTAGMAKCACSPDPVCSAAGNACGDTATATVNTCAQDAQTGCVYQSSASTCSTGLVCERYVSPACADPNWAEWPMPNGPGDVAAGAPNPESYTDNGDQTVTDNVTGLMWQQAIAPGTYSNVAALAYCPTVTLGGHRDWRLPSIIELVSLVDYGSSTFINGTYFPGPATPFIPSTAPGNWTVNAGNVSYGPPIMGSVRCVR